MNAADAVTLWSDQSAAGCRRIALLAHRRMFWAFSVCLAVGGCGGSQTAPALAPPPARSAAANADIRRLVLDAATSGETCAKLRDRFIGLRAKGPTGAAAGETPIVGRWRIVGCSVGSTGNALTLHLSGPAWYWIDKEKSGYAVHQYLYFDVDATMQGALDIGYDPGTRLASIWFTPTDAARVIVKPLTAINLHAQNFFAWLLLPFATPRAYGAVVGEGEQQFRDRLDTGMTMTIDLARNRQVDLLLGQLPRGQAPERPYAPGIPWLADERIQLHAGAAQVEGPFPAQRTSIDGVLEAGSSVEYSLVCVRDLQIAFNSVSKGQEPQVPPNAVFAHGAWWPRGPQTTPVTASCPWYLVTATPGPEAVAAIRVRKGQATNAQDRSKVVRVTLVSFHISGTKPTGKPWDGMGGAPDPYFVIGHDGTWSSLAPKEQDTFNGAPNAAAPEPFELTPGHPIKISATDKDVMFDDPIGTATLRYKQVTKSGEVELPLLLGGAQTGSVRVRVDIVR